MSPELQRLIDLEDIRKLRVKYSHLLDSNDLERLGELFSEDVVCDFGFGVWQGRDELKRHLADVHTDYDVNHTGSYPYLHSVSNHWIELTGPESADGRCYLTCWVTAHAERNPLLLLGIYADCYTKRDGVWRISRSRVDYIWPDRNIAEGTPGGGSSA